MQYAAVEYDWIRRTCSCSHVHRWIRAYCGLSRSCILFQLNVTLIGSTYTGLNETAYIEMLGCCKIPLSHGQAKTYFPATVQFAYSLSILMRRMCSTTWRLIHLSFSTRIVHLLNICSFVHNGAINQIHVRIQWIERKDWTRRIELYRVKCENSTAKNFTQLHVRCT